jgi:hypothetical protein
MCEHDIDGTVWNCHLLKREIDGRYCYKVRGVVYGELPSDAMKDYVPSTDETGVVCEICTAKRRMYMFVTSIADLYIDDDENVSAVMDSICMHMFGMSIAELLDDDIFPATELDYPESVNEVVPDKIHWCPLLDGEIAGELCCEISQGIVILGDPDNPEVIITSIPVDDVCAYCHTCEYQDYGT